MKLLATSAVRGSRPGESHGGAWLIDLEGREVRRVVDCAAAVAMQPDSRDRGLRGIAFDGETVYIAGSDELFAFAPDFRPVGSWRNAYLKDCHGIAVWERTLFLAATGCDAILGFDLDHRQFTWAMQVVTRQFRFISRAFNPGAGDGPLLLDKLHLDAVHCTRGGMYVSGTKTGGLLLFNGREVQMAVELPAGSRDARPFRDGVLFNDTEAGVLRYAGRGDGREDRAMRVPEHPAERLQGLDQDPSGMARPGFARGLAVLNERLVAGGSSPATVTVYDLAENRQALSVNLAMDVRHAIQGLAAWPY